MHYGELHIEGLHAQNRMANLGQECQQLLGILGADGFVSDHVGEVVNTVHFLSGSVQMVTDLILQQLGQPNDTAGTAFSSDELVRGDEVLAMAHEARSLHTTTGHGSHLGEGHAQRSHAGMLTAGDNNAHGNRLDTTDTLEAATGGHGILEQGVQSNMLQSAMGVLVNSLINVYITAQLLVQAVVLGNNLAGTGGIQLVGSLSIQPRHGATQTQTLGGNDTNVAGWHMVQV